MPLSSDPCAAGIYKKTPAEACRTSPLPKTARTLSWAESTGRTRRALCQSWGSQTPRPRALTRQVPSPSRVQMLHPWGRRRHCQPPVLRQCPSQGRLVQDHMIASTFASQGPGPCTPSREARWTPARRKGHTGGTAPCSKMREPLEPGPNSWSSGQPPAQRKHDAGTGTPIQIATEIRKTARHTP
jgi:hypothetical protein